MYNGNAIVTTVFSEEQEFTYSECGTQRRVKNFSESYLGNHSLKVINGVSTGPGNIAFRMVFSCKFSIRLRANYRVQPNPQLSVNEK